MLAWVETRERTGVKVGRRGDGAERRVRRILVVGGMDGVVVRQAGQIASIVLCIYAHSDHVHRHRRCSLFEHTCHPNRNLNPSASLPLETFQRSRPASPPQLKQTTKQGYPPKVNQTKHPHRRQSPPRRAYATAANSPSLCPACGTRFSFVKTPMLVRRGPHAVQNDSKRQSLNPKLQEARCAFSRTKCVRRRGMPSCDVRGEGRGAPSCCGF